MIEMKGIGPLILFIVGKKTKIMVEFVQCDGQANYCLDWWRIYQKKIKTVFDADSV